MGEIYLQNQVAEDMARDAFAAMDDQQKVGFATDMILSVDAPNLVHVLELSSNMIGRHAHEVAAKAMPSRRSDGSTIGPLVGQCGWRHELREYHSWRRGICGAYGGDGEP